MSTYNNLVVSNQWRNILLELSITQENLPLIIQNKGARPVSLSFTETIPDNLNEYGIILAPQEKITISYLVSGLFARADVNDDPVKCELAFEDAKFVEDGIPSDIFTTNQFGIRRLAVDSQQTSFEDNKQFKFVDEFIDIPYTTYIVYKITLGCAINLFERKISVYTGGRKYYVYPWTSDSEVTGSPLVTQRSPSPVSTDLKDGLLVHPSSLVTITRYETTTAPVFDKDWIDVEHERTDGTANRATTEFSADSVRAGYANGTVVWVYLPSIAAQNGATNGFLRLVWEERRDDY